VIVSTINVNGIRAAVKERSPENQGLLPWLKTTRADVVCLQETRADDEQLAEALAPALADGWHLASADSHVKGRNGVAVMSRHPITRTLIGPASENSAEFSAHGRYLEVDTGDLTVVAEGIESAAQVTVLQAMGPILGQGYHFARPLAADAAGAFMAGRPAPGGQPSSPQLAV